MFEKNIIVRCLRVLVLLLIVFSSCTKTPQYIDTSKQSDNLYLLETDTLQPVYVMTRLDSFQTSGNNRSVIGKNFDPYFGLINSRSFIRIALAAGDYKTIGSQIQGYDSIRLIMRLDHTYSGDTTMPWSASVYRLTETLDPTGNTANQHYYNHNSLAFQSTPLGSTSITLRPNVSDSVVIPLDDALGQEIWSFYKNKNENVSTQALFQQYFKGICVQPNSSSNVIYGFNAADTGTTIRLYYHEDQGIRVTKTLDFKAEGGLYQFNNITNDPTGTITEAIVKDKDVPSSALGHQVFVSDLAGVITKFTLPSIKSLPTIPDYVRLQSMVLKLVPVASSFGKYPLPPYLGLGISNEASTSLTPIYTSDNTKIQNGNLNIDIENGISTAYTYDLSNLGRFEITSTPLNTNTVYLQPLSASNTRTFTFQRLVAADNSNAKSPSKVITQMLFFKK